MYNFGTALLLISRGVPPMMRDGTGKTAMDIATQFKHSDCADYLNEVSISKKYRVSQKRYR